MSYQHVRQYIHSLNGQHTCSWLFDLQPNIDQTRRNVKMDMSVRWTVVPIATKVVCYYRLLKCLRSLYDKQCRPRLDCSYI